MTDLVKAFAYLRVSGRGQIEGDGFDRQLIACNQYAAAHQLEIVEVFREEGVSGTKELEDRPALSELFAALEENGVKTVIVEKLDRVARDLMVQETILADMQKNGYTLVSSAEPDLCSTDPSRVLIRQIFGALAQWERAMITIKLRGARQRLKSKNGKCEGRKAFGENAHEAPILEQMLACRERGDTTSAIAESFNRDGVPTRSGALWRASTVAKILARHRNVR